MDKKTFKSNFITLLDHEVVGLPSEEKVKYMKKWIKDYELGIRTESANGIDKQDTVKVGVIVRTTLQKLVQNQLLSEGKVRLLQDERYCKTTFDINYPFLKKVQWGTSLSDQRKVNGYDRYWANEITIYQDRYFICNDWYERNRQRFIKWVNNIEK